MRRHPRHRLLLSLLACALAIVGCGSENTSTPTVAASNVRQVQGAIVKGPLVGATVAFYNLDAGGQAAGLPILTATTDAFGHVTGELPAGDAPLLAVSSGGSYVDESDDAGGTNRRRITLAEDEGFAAVVMPDADTFCMTPYSMALLLRARRISNGANFIPVYEAVREQATSVLGFDPTTVIPDDPLAPDLQGDPDSVKYALLLGGAAYAINAIAVDQGVAPTYEIVRAFIDDLSDGTVDGELGGNAIEVKAVIDDVDLNGEILRFRNNHFQLYNGLLVSVNEEDWAEETPLPDNLPPFARMDAIEVAEGGTASVLVGGAASVLDNDSDTAGASLVASLVSPPAHGTLAFHPDGTFSYAHDGTETLTDVFTYRANNGTQDSPAAVVTIQVDPVNDAPVALDDSYAGTEGSPIVIAAPGILGNDTDAEGSELTALLHSGPAHGSLTLSPSGGFVYTPAQRFSGEDTFAYRASDGDKASAIATVTLRIAEVNSAPIAQDDTFEAFQNATLVVPAPGVKANDSDADGDTLSAVLVTPPTKGTLTLSSNGRVSYQPETGFLGQVSFQYQLFDGLAASNVATATINVLRANRPPVGGDDFYQFYGDPIVAPDPNGDPPRQGIFDNDSDPDGDRFTAELVTDVENGTLVFNGKDGSFVYTPDTPPDPVDNFKASRGFGIQDQFTYRLTDGYSYSQPVTVTIGSFIICDGPCQVTR